MLSAVEVEAFSDVELEGELEEFLVGPSGPKHRVCFGHGFLRAIGIDTEEDRERRTGPGVSGVDYISFALILNVRHAHPYRAVNVSKLCVGLSGVGHVLSWVTGRLRSQTSGPKRG